MIDWHHILGEHKQSVWSTIYRILGNEADTADCFQDTFIDALEFSKKQRVKNFGPFLTRIATCRAIDRLRGRYRKPNQVTLAQAEEIGVLKSLDCPAGEIQKQESSEILLEALASIDSTEAEIFCLKHLDDLSYSEIADITGLKENNIGVMIHRTKNKLKVFLEKSEYGTKDIY